MAGVYHIIYEHIYSCGWIYGFVSKSARSTAKLGRPFVMNLSINKCTVVVVIVIVTHHMMHNNDAILKVGPFFGLLFVAEQSSPYFIRMYVLRFC